MKYRYLYIFNLEIWLVVDILQIYRFYTNISSTQPPRVVSELCLSILSNLRWIDLFFSFVGLILASKIPARQGSLIYMLFIGVVCVGLTIFNIFGLGDSLYHYAQQQGIWSGGSPTKQYRDELLAVLEIGIIVTAIYVMNKIILWMMSKLRDRNN